MLFKKITVGYNEIHMQLKILSILFILIFGLIISLGVFSFSLVEHGSFHACPIGDCSSISNALSLVLHHISGLQGLVQAIVSFDPILLTSLVLLLGLFLLVSSELLSQIIFGQDLSYQKHLIKEVNFKLNDQFLRWLAFHNKRDPHVLHWVHDTNT